MEKLITLSKRLSGKLTSWLDKYTDTSEDVATVVTVEVTSDQGVTMQEITIKGKFISMNLANVSTTFSKDTNVITF